MRRFDFFGSFHIWGRDDAVGKKVILLMLCISILLSICACSAINSKDALSQIIDENSFIDDTG